jgi:hypothetical protein
VYTQQNKKMCARTYFRVVLIFTMGRDITMSDLF